MPTLDRLARTGVLAVLRAPSAEAALHAVDALVTGGVTGLEITYSTPEVARVLATVAGRYGDRVYLGAGTITRPEQAEESVAAGAQFLVSPGTLPDLVAAMQQTGALVMSGALTPSEVMTAAGLGVDVVKIFPASLGGPGYLRALRAPLPDVVMMPTGGVAPDNVADWVAAGAIAVGAGGDLVPSSALAAGDWEAITARARAFTAAWRTAQQR